MMNRLENAARQALEALEPLTTNAELRGDSLPDGNELHSMADAGFKAITDLREALAEQQAAGPVACKGIPRKGCNYLAPCDTVCNKCGQVHYHHQMVAIASAPTQQPLTDEQKAVLRECRNQAMKWAAQAGIPECAAFGGIAQDLDWLCGQLGIAENEKGGAA